MPRIKNRDHHIGKNLLMLVFASILLASLGMPAMEIFAMGQSPGTCHNRYDGTITAMKVAVGHKTYNPIVYPGLSFQLQNDRSYIVIFTIHTPSKSSQGSSMNGSTWYDTSAPGYFLGQCINGVGPNEYITITSYEGHPANLSPVTKQTVSWHTLLSGDITYGIKWINPPI